MGASTVLVLVLALPAADGLQGAGPPPQELQSPDLLQSAPAAVHDPLACDAVRNDARLADVCFVDAEHGWAVGDRGTIWHTDDGGRRWHLQPSGVTCALESVCFLDAQTGWAAGGSCQPYTHTSTGVLLSTGDGGRHWQQNRALLLPALRQIRFFDQKHGWAVGNPSAMFPSGVFVTDSGGRGFKPLSGPRMAPWLAGDLLDPRTGALAGRNGTVAMVRRAGVEPARTGSLGLRNLARLKLVPPVQGWLVGEGGLVMKTGDLGATWQTPPGELPEAAAGQLDFGALAVRGAKCWVAGSPGSRIFHTADDGRTWTAFATGTPLPIHALSFVDDEHGWAVGELGTILASSDGGRTWQLRHAGGSRAALLGIFSQGRQVPLELFADLCGSEGYLGVVEVVNRQDVEVEPRAETHPADRVHQALVAVGADGGHTAWQFPLRQPGLVLSGEQIIRGWDRVNDGRGLAELERHLVRQIRVWRPDVVVTEEDDPQGDNPLGHLIDQLVLQAVEKAADPTSFSEQITHAGLEPWTVKKVYAMLPPGTRGTTELTTAKFAVRLGRSLAEVAGSPRGLLDDQFRAAPQTLGFRLLLCNLPQEQGRGDFFSGIVLRPGEEARRALIDPPAEGLELARRSAKRHRNVQAILEQAEKDPQGSSGLLAQAGELAQGMDADSAGRVLYQLGQGYCHKGRWPSAAETFTLLAERYPEHPLALPAMLWLLQYYASGEAAWRVQGGQRFAVRQASALSIDTSQQEDRPGLAAGLGRKLEKTRPELFAADELQFPLAVAARAQGFPRQAERFYLARARSANHDAWWACAQGEQWLAEPRGLPPKPLLHCQPARSKPRLDGCLEDEVWQHGKPAQLHSAQHDDADWPGVVMLAYDAEFLYVAISARQAPAGKYPPGEGPRPRDGDLSQHDRVDVLLDLDRDFTTYYRLTIDHRGFTGEGCWGDRTWDPTWFVAARTAEGVWTAEAAIPMDQLTGRYPAARDVWAVGIQRTVPGVGFQSWSTPAATTVVPEGFGYLIFD